ncbi:epidermal growth factor receptor kinase substrate 8-like [Lethenteron reissneri]|uniref:epidermal growth factor receptor kinase substrate 8-like n=1 Tax=Lethenteron reissneri TaxID=7753 RepID=UPI002AB7F26E|nr:epidermal growth factor receptor kinase substrate 8-like [Lethenteron reissneri]
MDDVTNHRVEHLAMFSVDKRAVQRAVPVGVRKLHVLQHKGKVWSQEMMLQVNGHSVCLISKDTQDVLENFPLASVQRVEAVPFELEIGSSREDGLLAILCQDDTQSRPDIHLFSCRELPVNLVCQDITSALADAQAGKGRAKERPAVVEKIRKLEQQREDQSAAKQRPADVPPGTYTYTPFPAAAAAPIPRPESVTQQQQPPPEAAALPKGVRSKEGAERAKPAAAVDRATPRLAGEEQGGHGAKEAGVQRRADDKEELAEHPDMQAFKVVQNTQTLTRALEDVDFFVAKLDRVASACRELHKRKGKGHSARVGSGVGVLTLRAKPPTEEEFIECLQKIKFSFNLLARLKDHLHDPTADEHVQSLFQTLTRVVQESGGPELAETVVSPLLTRDALLLLAPCTGGDGIHLWSSLGEAWNTPRSAWNKPAPVPHYVPVFRSGWHPPAQKKVSFVDAEPSQPSPSAWPPGQTRGMARCLYDYVARSSSEISVLAGDVLQVLDSTRSWWKVASKGAQQTGYVPHNILEPLNYILYPMPTPEMDRGKGAPLPPPLSPSPIVGSPKGAPVDYYPNTLKQQEGNKHKPPIPAAWKDRTVQLDQMQQELALKLKLRKAVKKTAGNSDDEGVIDGESDDPGDLEN